MISLICGIQKIQQTSGCKKRETDTGIKNKPVVTSGEREKGRVNIGVGE